MIKGNERLPSKFGFFFKGFPPSTGDVRALFLDPLKDIYLELHCASQLTAIDLLYEMWKAAAR
jgi:hypothetical protein